MGELPDLSLRLARDATGKLIGTSAIGLNPEPFSRPLTCPDRHCAAPLVPVREYARGDDEGASVTVSAHFRLAPTAQHLPGCTYDAVRSLSTIAEESGGAVRAARGHVKLLLPTVFGGAHDGAVPPPSRSRHRLRRLRAQGPTAANVINSAAAIQRFLERYPHDEAALDFFEVLIGTHRVPWRDFCLGTQPDSIVRLAGRLAVGLVTSHPIAIHGVITGSGTARTGTTVYVEHDLHRKLETGGQPRWLYVRLRSRDPHLLEWLGLGRRFMAIGEWDLFNPEAARVAELVLWVRKPWQVAAWDDARPRQKSVFSASRGGSATGEADAVKPDRAITNDDRGRPRQSEEMREEAGAGEEPDTDNHGGPLH